MSVCAAEQGEAFFFRPSITSAAAALASPDNTLYISYALVTRHG